MPWKAVARNKVSPSLACRAFEVSVTCYRYSPKSGAETEEITDLQVGSTDALKTWGFVLHLPYLRHEKRHLSNHKRVDCIYCAAELKLRIIPRTRLKRDKPDALAAPDALSMT